MPKKLFINQYINVFFIVLLTVFDLGCGSNSREYPIIPALNQSAERMIQMNSSGKYNKEDYFMERKKLSDHLTVCKNESSEQLFTLVQLMEISIILGELELVNKMMKFYDNNKYTKDVMLKPDSEDKLRGIGIIRYNAIQSRLNESK